MFKKILAMLTPGERRRGFFLLIMILIMAMMDTVGVASIMPFMMVLGQPDIVHTNDRLNLIYTLLGFSDPGNFLFFLGAVVFLALMASILFKVLTHYALLRFTQMRNHSLSCRLFKGYLGRPYVWFLNQHSANLGKSILSEVSQVINGVLVPAMQLIAHGTIALFLIVLLMLLDPILVLMVALGLGGAYLFIYVALRRYLSYIGADRVLANKQRFKVAQEALGGIKEVKIFGREFSLLSRFTDPSLRFARHQFNSSIASQLPRFFLELLTFGSVLLIALYLFRFHGDFSRALPVLAVYAFAGYRLLPALHNVYNHATRLRFSLPALESLYEDILELPEHAHSIKQEKDRPLAPENHIQLRNIDFAYPNAATDALKDINLTIPVGSTIGLVGATGAGKTTMVDIILGLLSPRSGQLLVDDKPVTQDNVRAWQRALGYVPQQIYLSDDTVTANIAFGIPPDRVDMEAVVRASKIAELHEFVSRELPDGYDTLVGERGVRLSGGQRQRVGIARALYHDPAVLIFDEATSALDNLTEKAVMASIHKMGNIRTIILIAHRLTTVKDCDCIYIIEQGEITRQGAYHELLEISRFFRALAAAGDGSG